jgi:hypothetical protein
MNRRSQHAGNSRHSVIVPYRIGVLLDREDAAHCDLIDAVRLGIDESRDSGALDRDVDLVVRKVRGAPDGSALDVIAEWRELFDKDTLLGMIGPFGDDNGAAVREWVEAGELPTLTTSADDGFTGRHCFQLTVDHLMDHLHLLLRHGRAMGLSHPILIREPGPRGAALEVACRRAARQDRFASLEVVERDARLCMRLAHARGVGADCLIYLGGGWHAQVGAALREIGWAPVKLTGTEICRAHPVGGEAPSFEGWIGFDAVHAGNTVFQRFARNFEDRFGRPGNHLRGAQGYDIGRLIGIVCTTIRPPSPEGLRDGLDRIRMLPAATGAPGTVICFTRYDHRGIKNDMLVLAEVRSGVLAPLAPR